MNEWTWKDRLHERLMQSRYGAKTERSAPTRQKCMLSTDGGRLRLLCGTASKHKTPQGRFYNRRLRLLRLRRSLPWYGSPCWIGPHEYDHEWKLIDDSFDHEFGTQRAYHWECQRCDVEDASSDTDFYDDDEAEWDYYSAAL